MDQQCRIAPQVKKVANLINREFHHLSAHTADEVPLTVMQRWIIRYLYIHADGDVFQKDLEAFLSLRSSSVTSLLQLMEKHGLIRREAVAGDRRLKRIVMTDRARRMHPAILRDLERVEQKLIHGLSEEEIATLERLLARVRANLE